MDQIFVCVIKMTGYDQIWKYMHDKQLLSHKIVFWGAISIVTKFLPYN